MGRKVSGETEPYPENNFFLPNQQFLLLTVTLFHKHWKRKYLFKKENTVYLQVKNNHCCYKN